MSSYIRNAFAHKSVFVYRSLLYRESQVVIDKVSNSNITYNETTEHRWCQIYGQWVRVDDRGHFGRILGHHGHVHLCAMLQPEISCVCEGLTTD